MALIRNITDKRNIPHEPGEWLLLRKLTWRQLEAAREERGNKALEKMRRIGGDMTRAFMEIEERQARVTQEATERVSALGLPPAVVVEPVEVKPERTLATELARYDLDMLLSMGIANWSYPEPFSKDAMLSLDKRTSQWAGEQLLDLADALRDEGDVKNG